jgi:hypothetical protein
MALVSRISFNSVTVITNGRVRTVRRGAPNFETLRNLLKTPPEERDAAFETDVANIVDIPTFVALETHGDVSVSNNEVRYRGEIQSNLLATRILQHLAEGFSVKPLALFMNKLMTNPLPTVRDDLFAWLESGDMPITDDGDILAYKKVRSDFYSFYAGKNGHVLHALHTFVSMDREDVDPERSNECSTGLHFCSYPYLAKYHGNQGRVLLVKIDPSDVVAIPTDYNRQKGRTWRMFIYGEIDTEEVGDALSGHLVMPVTESMQKADSAPEVSEGSNLVSDQNGVRHTVEDVIALFDGRHPSAIAESLGISVAVLEQWAQQAEFDIGAYNPRKVRKASTRKAKKKEAKGLSFTFNGIHYTANAVTKGVSAHGQRGYSKKIGVPRTTIQTWIKRINANQA